MKKVLSTLLIIVLCTALMLGVLSGCGKQDPQGGESTTEGSNNTTGGDNTSGGDETPDDPAGGEQKLLTWEEYQALSDADKDAYFRSFEDVSAYNDWYFAAYDEYKKNEEMIVIDPNNPVIDMDISKK